MAALRRQVSAMEEVRGELEAEGVPPPLLAEIFRLARQVAPQAGDSPLAAARCSPPHTLPTGTSSPPPELTLRADGSRAGQRTRVPLYRLRGIAAVV
jgi:hypothetical protein